MEALVFFLASLFFQSLLPIWLPWWVLAPIQMVLVFPFRLSKSLAFWLGGFAAGLAWLGYSLYLSFENQHILAPRLSQVLKLPHPMLLFGIIFLLPFLLAGLASYTGLLIKKFVRHNGYQ